MIFGARATRGLRRCVQGREELSLLPERAPSEGPRSTAAVESSSHPPRLGNELEESNVRVVEAARLLKGHEVWSLAPRRVDAICRTT